MYECTNNLIDAASTLSAPPQHNTSFTLCYARDSLIVLRIIFDTPLSHLPDALPRIKTNPLILFLLVLDMALKIQLPLSLSSTIDKLQERVLRLLEITPPERRIIIALSGVPGSGKSTIVAGLLANLSHAGMRDVAVAPMVSQPPISSEWYLIATGWLPLLQSISGPVRRSRIGVSTARSTVHVRCGCFPGRCELVALHSCSST